MSNFNPVGQMDIASQISAIKSRANAKYQRDLLKEYQQNQIDATLAINQRLKNMQIQQSGKDAISGLTGAGQIAKTVYDYYKKKKDKRLKKLKQAQQEGEDVPTAEEFPEAVEAPRGEDYDLNLPSSDSSVYSDMGSIESGLSDASSHASSGVARLDDIRSRGSLNDEDKEFFENWGSEDPLPDVSSKIDDFNFDKAYASRDTGEEGGIELQDFDPYSNLPGGEAQRIGGERPLFGAEDDVEYLDRPSILGKVKNVFGNIRDAIGKKIQNVKDGFESLKDTIKDPLGAGGPEMEYEKGIELSERKDWASAIEQRLQNDDESVVSEPERLEPELVEDSRQIGLSADPNKGTYTNEPSEDQLAAWREDADIKEATQRSLNPDRFDEEPFESGAPAETYGESQARLTHEGIAQDLNDDALGKLPQDSRYDFSGFDKLEEGSEFGKDAQDTLKRVSARGEKEPPMDAAEEEALNTGAAPEEGAEIAGELGETEAALAGADAEALAVPGVGEVLAGVGAAVGVGYAAYSGIKYLTENPQIGQKLGSDVSDFGKMFSDKNYTFGDFTHDFQNPFGTESPKDIPAHRVQMTTAAPQTNLSGAFVGNNPNMNNQF